MDETATAFFIPPEANIEELRLILEHRTGHPISFDDASEIATQLISLYECLARNRSATEPENG